MEAIMEAVSVSGVISGSAVVKDLCRRITERLSRDCDLRASDAYSGYSARVTIELQLHDVRPVEVVATVEVGRIDSQLPVARIDLGSNVVIAASDQPNLERPVVSPPEPPVEASPVEAAQVEPEPMPGPTDTRWYVRHGDEQLPYGLKGE